MPLESSRLAQTRARQAHCVILFGITHHYGIPVSGRGLGKSIALCG